LKFFIFLKPSTPCILAISFLFLFQLKAHIMLNTYIYHLLPSKYFSVCYTIFRETMAYLLTNSMLFAKLLRAPKLWHSEDRASWYILIIKPTRCTNSQIFLIKYSRRFGQVHCPSSGVSQHCTHAIGMCHASSVGSLLAWSADLASRQST
jgi:hypothetical protein